MIFPKNEEIVNGEDGTAEFEWHTIAQRLPDHIGDDDLGRLLVCPRIEFATPSMLADPKNNARGSLQLEFKWSRVNDRIFVTQNELLIELQNGEIFNYRGAPTALA
jgi:hypothetical protein